jgi:hypothetical protein
MNRWLTALVSAGCAAAALALGCSGSNDSVLREDAGGRDASPDATTEGSTTTCGNLGQPCCNADQCFGSLTCNGGTCVSLPDGVDAASDDGGSHGGADAPSGDAPGGDDGPNDDGTAPDAGDDGAADAGADVSCGSLPTLHEDEGGTIYCGFAADGGVLDCPTGQQCCLGGSTGGGVFLPDECTSRGAACANGGAPDAGIPAIPIACTQIADCTANGVAAVACCLQGASAPAPQPGCSYPRSKGGSAIVCETGTAGTTAPAACATGEVNICSSQADCPSGKTCTPGKWKIFQVGFCL